MNSWLKEVGSKLSNTRCFCCNLASLLMDSLKRSKSLQQPLQGSFRLSGPSDFVPLQTHGEDRLQLMFGLYIHCTLLEKMIHFARAFQSGLVSVVGISAWP